MPPELPDPTRSQEWLRRARSNLHRAKMFGGDPEAVYEDSCFDAQQAAEKSLKGLLVHLAIPFPKTHSIADLITLVAQAGEFCTRPYPGSRIVDPIRRGHPIPRTRRACYGRALPEGGSIGRAGC